MITLTLERQKNNITSKLTLEEPKLQEKMRRISGITLNRTLVINTKLAAS